MLGLIDSYNAQQDEVNKEKIIELLTSSIRYDPLQEAESLTNEQLHNVIAIQNFLPKAISAYTGKHFFINVLLYYAGSMPPARSSVLLNKLLHNANNSLSISDSILVQFDLSFANNQTQEEYLPKIVQQYYDTNSSKKQRNAFVQTMAILLSHASSLQLTPKSQERLLSILRTNQLYLENLYYGRTRVHVINWLNTYTVVSSRHEIFRLNASR